MYSELFCIPLKQRVVRWIADWISSRYIIVWSERSLWLRLLIAYLITLDAYIAVKVFFFFFFFFWGRLFTTLFCNKLLEPPIQLT